MAQAAPLLRPFDHLSPRQRECLRLVFAFKTSKDIERELGIAKNTVDGYLAEAVRTLGARDRKHAAILFAEFEGRAPQAPAEMVPQVESGDHLARVAAPAPDTASEVLPGTASDWRSSLPLRRKEARHNPLRPVQRLVWIVGLAILMMVAFGMLVSGLAVLTEIFRAIGLVAPR